MPRWILTWFTWLIHLMFAINFFRDRKFLSTYTIFFDNSTLQTHISFDEIKSSDRWLYKFSLKRYLSNYLHVIKITFHDAVFFAWTDGFIVLVVSTKYKNGSTWHVKNTEMFISFSTHTCHFLKFVSWIFRFNYCSLTHITRNRYYDLAHCSFHQIISY